MRTGEIVSRRNCFTLQRSIVFHQYQSTFPALFPFPNEINNSSFDFQLHLFQLISLQRRRPVAIDQ